MYIQERDGQIWNFLYEFGGVLGRWHLQELFWPHASLRAMNKRLRKHYDAQYINWPDQEQRNMQPGPKSIVWLGWKGILWVASQRGVDAEPPKNTGENQMRLLARRLRRQGIRWVRRPNWLQLEHDLAVVDFRLTVGKSINELPQLELETWIPESEFRVDTDVVSFDLVRRDGRIVQEKRGVIPDGYFIVADEQRRLRGQPHRARFLLELDQATHSNAKFAVRKIAAGGAYIVSPEYRARFDCNDGYWLVVTTGEIRMKNLMRHALRVAGRDVSRFFFTTENRLRDTKENIFTSHIWFRVGENGPVQLIE